MSGFWQPIWIRWIHHIDNTVHLWQVIVPDIPDGFASTQVKKSNLIFADFELEILEADCWCNFLHFFWNPKYKQIWDQSIASDASKVKAKYLRENWI